MLCHDPRLSDDPTEKIETDNPALIMAETALQAFPEYSINWGYITDLANHCDKKVLVLAAADYVLVDLAASLAAAISLLERTPQAKKAAPSDKMFDTMLADYKKSLERARTYLRGQNADKKA